MKTKNILFVIFFIVLLFPIYAIFQIFNLGNATAEDITSALSFFQISLWVSWMIFAVIAVYLKWTHKENIFFILTYIFIGVGFGLFGYLTQQAIADYEITTRFGEEFPLGVFSAIRNIVVSAALTVFLQLAVFWFTRRWHRR